MHKTEKRRWKSKKRAPFYYMGFLSIFIFWLTATCLCYFGVIAFDPKTIDGAVILGLGLTASVYSVIAFLKKLYDNEVSIFKKKGG